jgi:hypothetical protein
MESKEIFSMALYISKPWYIENAEMNLNKVAKTDQVGIKN